MQTSNCILATIIFYFPGFHLGAGHFYIPPNTCTEDIRMTIAADALASIEQALLSLYPLLLYPTTLLPYYSRRF